MVNVQYLSSGMVKQVRRALYSNEELPCITLQQFFSKEEYSRLSKEASKAAFKRGPDKMHASYGYAPLPKLLRAALEESQMRDFLSAILGKGINKIEGELCQFGWKDYTLLHDHAVEKPGVDLIVDFTPEWDEGSGGKIVYVDGTGDSRNIPASPNTLSLAIRKEGAQKFVQYCNHYSGKKKRILFLGRVS